jgi:hypothetical protein
MLHSADVLRTGLPPANDRMLTTCFLAALLHGIVILGVTFSSTSSSLRDDGAPGLEVVLVNERVPSVPKNPNARYLSQRTQLGSGNTLKAERSLIPKSSLMPVDRLGVPSGEGLDAQRAGADTGWKSWSQPTVLRRRFSISPLPARPRTLPSCHYCSRNGRIWR